MNKVILLHSRPTGKPTLSNFEFVDESIPVAGDGELLLKACYVSVDPYLRGRMNDANSYTPPFELNKPIQSAIVAEVVESNLAGYQKGDFVMGYLEWKQFQTSSGKGLMKVDPKQAPLSYYIGILGLTGLTAYLGLTDIGLPKAGETLVVSGAAGAVGSVVGQIGKLLGCHVVGIAGSDEKVELLKNSFGFDAGINYKTTPNMYKAIQAACPNGVDIYFDNVGGEISDAVLGNINKHARIIICGAISLYNATEQPMGPRLQPILLVKSATMRGFIVSDYYKSFPEGVKQLATWLQEGKLKNAETIVEGFDQIPQAFLDLFEGKNEGKMIVKV
ncbi:MAG: NADP-dependent oxidoreductase [Bacteroidetes bacterium]|nr:NADP-dependent oxidoreductase [Bacteroidota bacterium]